MPQTMRYQHGRRDIVACKFNEAFASRLMPSAIQQENVERRTEGGDTLSVAVYACEILCITAPQLDRALEIGFRHAD